LTWIDGIVCLAGKSAAGDQSYSVLIDEIEQKSSSHPLWNCLSQPTDPKISRNATSTSSPMKQLPVDTARENKHDSLLAVIDARVGNHLWHNPARRNPAAPGEEQMHPAMLTYSQRVIWSEFDPKPTKRPAYSGDSNQHEGDPRVELLNRP
jgi:hypothetical protein